MDLRNARLKHNFSIYGFARLLIFVYRENDSRLCREATVELQNRCNRATELYTVSTEYGS